MNDIRLALFQPDIPGNTGTILRFAACVGLTVDIIEPAGFDISDRAFRRAGMDYLEQAAVSRHRDWNAFEAWRKKEKRRLVVLTTQASKSYLDFCFTPGDILLFGRESAGLPSAVHEIADCRITIPMRPAARSINLAMSVAMATGEALRQVG